ncbi:MAG: NAD-dependent epimerase/dehydratase family protein [Bacteroidota bacterium]
MTGIEKSILLTGSSGFLGSRLLQKSKHSRAIGTVSLQSTPISQINLSGTDTIIHCAGIAHRMSGHDEKEYFKVNRDLTLLLAESAKANGVKHFIFLSTIKVFGLDSSDAPIEGNLAPSSLFLAPHKDAYGRSKLAAELGLKELESKDFTVSIIRPPLIYGPGAKGNLLKLMQNIQKGGMLPLGGIHNRRSMIFVDNLVALIDLIIEQKAAMTITPADQPAISTTKLVEELCKTINPDKKLISIPGFLRPLIRVLKPAFYHRLFGSLEVAPHPDLEKLGYQQKYSVEKGLKVMREEFLNGR